MSKKLEVIYDATPSGGCGCNCGCGGASKVEDMNELIEQLKTYKFESNLSVDSYEVSSSETNDVLSKLNSVLESTNASFRLDESNLEEALSEILPLVVLNGKVLTAYGIPTFEDVLTKVRDNI